MVCLKKMKCSCQKLKRRNITTNLADTFFWAKTFYSKQGKQTNRKEPFKLLPYINGNCIHILVIN